MSQGALRAASRADHEIDLLLRPPIAQISALDFGIGVQLIGIGYRCAVEGTCHL